MGKVFIEFLSNISYMGILITIEKVTPLIVIFGGGAYVWVALGRLDGFGYMILASLLYAGILWFQHAINIERHNENMD